MLIQPNLSPVPQKNTYWLLDDYSVKYGDITITVPACFSFDGASVPWFGQVSTYTPFHPDCMAPALIHDWLYLNHQTVRTVADQIFYDLLISNGANPTKSKLMYQAVKLAGGNYWARNKKDRAKLFLLLAMCKKSVTFEAYRFPMRFLQLE